MELAPEQERALAYLRRKGTDAAVSDLAARVRTALTQLEGQIDALPETVVRQRPAAGKWSVQEVVDHLRVSHRLAIDQLRAVLGGESVDVDEAIPAGLISEDPFALSWPAQVAALKDVHREFLAALAEGTDSTPLDARVPLVMVIKAQAQAGTDQPLARPNYEWIAAIDWKAFALALAVHTREHQDQIARILAS